MAKQKNQSQQVSINASEEILQGKYSNAVNVTSTGREVLIDFAFMYPAGEAPRATMVSRLIITPEMAKNLAASITQTLMKQDNS